MVQQTGSADLELFQLSAPHFPTCGDARSVADSLAGVGGAAVTVAPRVGVAVLVGVAGEAEPCGSRSQALNLALLLYYNLSCVCPQRCQAQNLKIRNLLLFFSRMHFYHCNFRTAWHYL